MREALARIVGRVSGGEGLMPAAPVALALGIAAWFGLARDPPTLPGALAAVAALAGLALAPRLGDAARVLGYPYAVGDKVAKAMPPLIMGRDTPLYACLDKHEKFEDGFNSIRGSR